MPYFKIPTAIVLDVSGPHAVRYTNARLTNDIVRLEVGSSCLAAALTPQGKTEGVFVVHKLAADSLKLICDGGDREGVIAAFRRYIVADRVDLKDESDQWILLHLFNEPQFNEPQDVIEKLDGEIFSSRMRTQAVGTDLLISKTELSKAENILKNITELSSDEVKFLRTKAGVPEFPTELNDDRQFLESQLDEAISSTKGCYTGQEVVERTKSLGKVARVLKRAEFQDCKKDLTGTKITTTSGIQIGEVVSAVIDPETKTQYAFVSIKNDETLFNADILAESFSGKVF